MNIPYDVFQASSLTQYILDLHLPDTRIAHHPASLRASAAICLSYMVLHSISVFDTFIELPAVAISNFYAFIARPKEAKMNFLPISAVAKSYVWN